MSKAKLLITDGLSTEGVQALENSGLFEVSFHKSVETEALKAMLPNFEGVVIRITEGPHAAFTVRRIASGVGVERTFPYNSPRVEGVEVKRRGRVRRARLYYLRGLTGRAARVKEALRR